VPGRQQLAPKSSTFAPSDCQIQLDLPEALGVGGFIKNRWYCTLLLLLLLLLLCNILTVGS
jgi:hypothetical protein